MKTIKNNLWALGCLFKIYNCDKFLSTTPVKQFWLLPVTWPNKPNRWENRGASFLCRLFYGDLLKSANRAVVQNKTFMSL